MKSEPSPLRDSDNPRRCGESSPSSDDAAVAGEGSSAAGESSSAARELDTLFQEPASSKDKIAALTSKLSAVVTENDALRQNVALLEEKLDRLHTEGGRMDLITAACEKANKEILQDSNRLVRDTGRRSLAELVESLSKGTVCGGTNAFVSSIVEALTLSEKETRSQSLTAAEVATQKKRKLHRLMAVEHMYCARNPTYVSELSIAAMSVAYAVCNSRLVVDMLGRIGPGGSYHSP